MFRLLRIGCNIDFFKFTPHNNFSECTIEKTSLFSVYLFLYCLQSHGIEVATGGIQSKKVLLKMSQTSQENTCAEVSFLESCRPQVSETSAKFFSVKFDKCLRTPFYTDHP